MFEGQPQKVEILKKETVDKTTVVLFKHKDKELYSVALESFLERKPDGLFEEFWDTSSNKLECEVVTTIEEGEALFNRRVEAEKKVREYNIPPTYQSSDEKKQRLLFGARNLPESKFLREICEKLAYLSYSSSDTSNKYFVIEPLLGAIRDDLGRRLQELSGINSPPELPLDLSERLNKEAEYIKELYQILDQSLTILYELRQIGVELR